MKARDVAIAIVLATAPPAVSESWDAVDPQERCAMCHGYFGNDPRPKFPKLAGQKPTYIKSQIQAFLDGERHNDGGQMVKTVTEITADDIPVVVDWFATQDPPTPTEAEDSEIVQTGHLVWVAARCGECHGIEDAGTKDSPYLTAQHPAYLGKQLRDFRDGQRDIPDQEKRDAIDTLSDADIDAVSAYLGQMPRKLP